MSDGGLLDGKHRSCHQRVIQCTPDLLATFIGHSDIVATFPGTKYIYSIIIRPDKVDSQICSILWI